MRLGWKMQQQQQQQTPCATIIDNETLIMTNTSLFHCDVTLYMLSLKKILFFQCKMHLPFWYKHLDTTWYYQVHGWSNNAYFEAQYSDIYYY